MLQLIRPPTTLLVMISTSVMVWQSSILIILMSLIPNTVAQSPARLMVISEKTQENLVQKFVGKMKTGETDSLKFDIVIHRINHEEEEAAYNDVCGELQQQTFAAIVDMSWGGWDAIKEPAQKNGLPYLRIETANHQFVKAGDDYLRDRDGIDAALIFANEDELDASLYWIIGNSYIRVIVLHLDSTPDAFTRLSTMRPAPNYYIAHGNASTLNTIYEKAKEKKLAKRDSRWNMVSSDWDRSTFPMQDLTAMMTFLQMNAKSCCVVLDEPDSDSCDCSGLDSPSPTFVGNSAVILVDTLAALAQENKLKAATIQCSASSSSEDGNNFKAALNRRLSQSRYTFDEGDSLLTYPITIDVFSRNKTYNVDIGAWSRKDEFVRNSDYKHEPIPRFFRVGTVARTPWTQIKRDSSGNLMYDADEKPVLEGYCVELLKQMADKMFFDYELILPTDGSDDFGARGRDGGWSGLIGDLVSGEVDIAVAAMTMTSEREEAVDFVAPYFDQSGISIILRKPVRPRSLFKFMEVLRIEVWLAILGALIVTGFMLWVLDRFSPYSARNNRAAHPPNARIFTLKESFWFALTSFTPQGGGEAPKALSGRVLVASYWLFVVLMLATFTANLAAFLTVERMQTTVQSLEELARQSKINYTVVANSSYMEYFSNMATAEEELYMKWKEMTLNSSGDQSKYRVWDYPIKEQYTHIFKVIQNSGPVKNAEEGFQRVHDAEDGNFAFIHDASEVRYAYYNNCNMTEVGEPFAEQPYAVAVQQGSHLQEEISRVILELQKDRFFETLYGKFWNSSLRTDCPTLDDSEGITLTSLGGVFIATLIGLVIAMITLGIEVFYFKKKTENEVSDVSQSKIISVLQKDRY